VNAQDPLANLRDIHLPDPVGWWPPAPGWWLLAILLLAILGGLLWWSIRRYRNNRYRREALAELAELQAENRPPLEQCQLTLALLRRTAKTAYPGRGLESERLPDMLSRLNNSGRKPAFDEILKGDLAELPYQPDPDIPPSLLQQLTTASRQWIKTHRRGKPC